MYLYLLHVDPVIEHVHELDIHLVYQASSHISPSFQERRSSKTHMDQATGSVVHEPWSWCQLFTGPLAAGTVTPLTPLAAGQQYGLI